MAEPGLIVSGGIRARIPQKLGVAAFWSCNLDAVVFQSDIVTFLRINEINNRLKYRPKLFGVNHHQGNKMIVNIAKPWLIF